MKTPNQQITSWIQEALDELYSEHLLPFKLTAYGVTAEGREWVVPFHDSRMHSVRFSWTDDKSFQETFRAAVLERVDRTIRVQPRVLFKPIAAENEKSVTFS